jgi:hypothetical protein
MIPFNFHEKAAITTSKTSHNDRSKNNRDEKVQPSRLVDYSRQRAVVEDERYDECQQGRRPSQGPTSQQGRPIHYLIRIGSNQSPRLTRHAIASPLAHEEKQAQLRLLFTKRQQQCGAMQEVSGQSLMDTLELPKLTLLSEAEPSTSSDDSSFNLFPGDQLEVCAEDHIAVDRRQKRRSTKKMALTSGDGMATWGNLSWNSPDDYTRFITGSRIRRYSVPNKPTKNNNR